MVKNTMAPSIDMSTRLSVPDMELINTNDTYTFTVNYGDLSGDFCADYDKTLRALHKHLGHIDGLDFYLYPEYSKNGRLHFHGTIGFDTGLSIALFYEALFRFKDHFACEVDTIKDTEKWQDYIGKNSTFMKLICEKWSRKYKVKKMTCYTVSQVKV